MKPIWFAISLAVTLFGKTAVATAQPHAADGVLMWRQNLDMGHDPSDYGLDRSVAVDNAGNVVIAGGHTDPRSYREEFMVAKLDREGTLLWQQSLKTTANPGGEAYAVAVDNEGNVIAAGFTVNTGTGADFMVAKFAGDGGAVLWQQTLNGTANGDDAALSVAVDNRGNVVAAGYTVNTDTEAFTVAKFDGDDGTLLWQRTVNGSANLRGRANSVAVDDEGNVAAAGYTFNTGTNLDFTVVKFDRAGTLLWQQTVNGTPNGYDVAMSVAVDNEGNVVAAGSASNSGANSGFTVAKFDREGARLWQQTVNGGRGGSAYSLAVDRRGNVAAAGYTNNGPSYYDFVVVKFDADGTLLWQQTLNGTGNYFDTAFSVAVDNQGNTVAGGWTNLSKDPFPWRFTLTVTKFDRDGTLLWKQDLTSSDSSANRALAVAVDNQGHVFAAGRCGQAFAVVKFAP